MYYFLRLPTSPIVGIALILSLGEAVGSISDDHEQQLTEIRAQLEQLNSEKIFNAAAIAIAPAGQERIALQKRADEIKKACEQLLAKERTLKK